MSRPISKRIGEALVEKGLITRSQLEKSVKAQLIFGGHIGTSLIELGYIGEECLGQTLADVFGVPYASFDLLHDIPHPVLHSIPVRLVEKHHVIPVRLEGKTLHLAVINPKNLNALDEISFVTGYKVVPWVAPEIRIYQAMEKHYDIPRRPRYIALCRELDSNMSNKAIRPPRGSLAFEQEVGDQTSRVLGVAALEPDTESPGNTPWVDVEAKYGYGKSWREILGEVIEDESAPRGDKDEGNEKLPRFDGAQPGPVRSLEEVSNLLSRAESKEELADAILAYASHGMARCILFMVKSTTAFVWDSRGLDLSRERTANMAFPVTSGSIFELLLGRDYYRGSVPDDARCRWFYNALQMEVPAEILLLPVYLNDRLVAILYGDGSEIASIQGKAEHYLRLTQKLALAMNMIIIKKKIRST